MRPIVTFLTVLLLLVALQTRDARADDDVPAGVPAKKHVQHRITVMWAPLRLLAPGVVEFTGEYRVRDKLGVSVELGAGRRTLERESPGAPDVPGTEIEAGAQVRYYLVGSFIHGMELGAEILYEYVKFDQPLPPGVIAVASGGGTIGPFLGYKIATNVGFTFEIQAGARYVAILPEVMGNPSVGGLVVDSRWGPILHINVGWSF